MSDCRSHHTNRWTACDGRTPSSPYFACMRTRYTSLLLVLCTITSYGQDATLTSNEMPPVGSTFTYRTVQNLATIDTTTGTDVVWDNSDILPTTQAPWDVDYMAPASSPHPTSFPTSNYCTFESEIPRYNYYDLNAARQERVGSWSTQQSTYTDGQIELTFPLQVGTTYTDTWDNTVSSFGGTYSLTCLSEGTLVLPNGIHENVLLTRILIHEIFDIVLYQWISATNGAQLLMYYPGDDVWVPEGAAYVLNMSIGIDEPGAPIDLRVQSLVDDHLMVSYASPGALDAVILSANGQALRSERLPASAAPSTLPVDVTGMAPGMYLVDLRAADGTHRAARFVKH